MLSLYLSVSVCSHSTKRSYFYGFISDKLRNSLDQECELGYAKSDEEVFIK